MLFDSSDEPGRGRSHPSTQPYTFDRSFEIMDSKVLESAATSVSTTLLILVVMTDPCTLRAMSLSTRVILALTSATLLFACHTPGMLVATAITWAGAVY